MAVTITNNLTNINLADVTTGWATIGGASSILADAETLRTGAASIGAKLSNNQGGVQFTQTVRDMTGEHVLIWARANVPIDPAGTGIRIMLGDGTNVNEYLVFTSTTYPDGWVRMNLQCDRTPTVNNSATINAITTIGVQFDTAQAIKGNIPTVWVDRIDVQPSATIYAIDVSGGTTGARGTWAEIIANAVANTDLGIVQAKFGIIAVNAPISFGTTVASTDSYFEDSDVTVVFQDQPVENGYFALEFKGGTGTNSFVLGSEVGTGDDSRGSGGGVIKSAGATFKLVATNASMNPLDFWGVTIDGADTTQWEQTNAQAVSCTWTNSGSITHHNNAEMREGVIASSTAVSGVGAIEFLQNPVTPDFRDMSIINCIHGIEWSINGATTMDLRGVKFAGNTADYRFNHTSGLHTVNVLESSDTPSTSDGGGGGTISVVASNPVTITVLDETDLAVVVGAEVYVEQTNGTLIVSGTTNASGIFSDTTSFSGAMVYKIRKSTATPFYIAIRRTGTIAAGTGFIAEVLMTPDNIVT